jgi:zinc transporter 9
LVSTIGLVIHSLADGAALGASFFCKFNKLSLLVSEKTEEASELGLVIFIAILLHKAPAALGFGTFLYHEGLRGWGIVKHLGVRNTFLYYTRRSQLPAH